MPKKILRVWHRRIGLLSFLMVIWLSVSGFIINHSDGFGFNEKFISYDWLLNLYGLKSSGNNGNKAAVIGDMYFYCVDGRLYKNAQIISECHSPIKNFVVTENYFVLMTNDAFLLILNTGELLEKIPFSRFDKHFKSMVFFDNRVLVQSETRWWQIDFDSLAMKEADTQLEAQALLVAPMKLSLIPDEFLVHRANSGITLERFLLDAHSGRIFGQIGVWIVDLFALLFVIMSLSGMFIFFKNR